MRPLTKRARHALDNPLDEMATDAQRISALPIDEPVPATLSLRGLHKMLMDYSNALSLIDEDGEIRLDGSSARLLRAQEGSRWRAGSAELMECIASAGVLLAPSNTQRVRTTQ